MLFIPNRWSMPIIDPALSSDDLPDGSSFVPTCKMKWSRLFFGSGFVWLLMHVVFAPEKVLTNTLQFAFSFNYYCDCFLANYIYYPVILRLRSYWPFYIWLPLTFPSDFLSVYCSRILECFCFGFTCSRWYWCFVVVWDYFGFW